MQKENDKKEPSLRSKQTKAGKLLSAFIRQIAEEETEVVQDPKTGDDRMASKAEALARLIWKKALGYTEKSITSVGVEEIKHNPDKYLMDLLFTRIEGKAPATIGDGDEKITVAERVSEQGKKRISEAGRLNANDS